MDNKTSFILKLHDWLIKICLILLVIFTTFYGGIYLLKWDWIYWCMISACTLTVLAVLLLSKFILDKNAKKTLTPFLLRGIFLVASIILIIVAARILGNYSFSYSPNRTHSILVQKTKFKQEDFIYAYKMKYGMFKIEKEYLLFSNNFGSLDKRSVIVWSNEDAAFVEGKYLDFHGDEYGPLGGTNFDEKYYLIFD